MVESAEHFLESSKLSSERDLKTFIPREYEVLKNSRRDQELALALAEETLPKTLAKKRLDFEKLKRDQRKAEKKLSDLRADAELLNIRAPAEGMVYYGACENGKWPTAATVAKKLIPGGKLSANEVFITILDPEKLILRAVVQEADLGKFKQGLKGHASPLAAPDKKLPVEIKDLGAIPMPGGGFETVLTVKVDRQSKIVPGMNAKVQFSNIQKPQALLVPKEAVSSEATQSVVYVLKKDQSHDKRVVKTGDSDETMIEITEGLTEGDTILLKKPEKKKTDE
jgi:multidrug efflux pump subunit AcrA (membrane-fusion protein)